MSKITLNFWHGQEKLSTSSIEPKEDSPLPRIIMAGPVVFLLHEVTCTLEGIEAQYQAESPMIHPAVDAINQHFFPSSKVQ